MSVSALILDPCTGQESEQALGVGEFRPDVGGRNKFTARIDGTTYTDYAREYRLTLSTGTAVTKNNLTVGQYVQPVLLWVQPELLTVGIPPIPNEFEHMTQLTRGVAFDERTGNFFGPLVPFPQSGVSVADTSTCAGRNGSALVVPLPTLSAAVLFDDDTTTSSTNSQLFVRAGDSIRLSGAQVNPDIPDNSTLEWTWGLVADSSVGTLDDFVNFTTSASGTTFEAEFPSSGAPTGDYVFQLNITQQAMGNTTARTTGSATIKVTLFSGADTVSVNSVTWTSAQSGTIGVICKSNYFVDSAVGLSVQVPGVAATAAMSATPPNSGTWSYSSRSVDTPGTVVCRSKLGGSATQVGQTV